MLLLHSHIIEFQKFDAHFYVRLFDVFWRIYYMRKNILIDQYSDEEFTRIVNTSYSMKEVVKNLDILLIMAEIVML